MIIFSFVGDVAIQHERVQRLGQGVLHSNEVHADQTRLPFQILWI